MPRTTQPAVQAIFDTTLSNVALDAWIGVANELVDDIADADSSIDSTRLTKIEKLLAAHFAATQEPRADRESRESASITYEGDTGMHINGTRYGQQAAILDPTGLLADTGKQQASITFLDSRGLSE